MIDSCLGYSLLSEYILMPLKKSHISEKTVITLLYYAIVKALLLVFITDQWIRTHVGLLCKSYKLLFEGMGEGSSCQVNIYLARKSTVH